MLYKLLMRVLLVCLIYHNAMQIGASVHKRRKHEKSIKRLNFSRDMLEGLGRNFIFLVPIV